MRYLRLALVAILAILLVTVAFANRSPVTLRVLPESMSGFLGWSWQITLPLFMVILAGLTLGLLIGFVWEWMREHKHRSAARREAKARRDLERDMARGTPQRHNGGDDVLALLEDGRTPH